VARRFQLRGTFHGAIIVDDYAHHPGELRASLKAARMRYPKARIRAVFQPHTFSRTRALLDEFAGAFEDADTVMITEIFAAREAGGQDVSSRQIVERMTHPNAQYVGSIGEAEAILRKDLRAGDVLITLGAGDIHRVATHLVETGRRESEHA
jgi:UDP-N-acetylmuramate--alanine ligase